MLNLILYFYFFDVGGFVVSIVSDGLMNFGMCLFLVIGVWVWMLCLFVYCFICFFCFVGMWVIYMFVVWGI